MNIRKGSIRQNEYRIMTKDGGIVWILSSSRPKYEKGHFAGLHGTVADITNLKRTEEELKRAQRELEIKSRNLEETNTALRVLLEHQDTEKKIAERNIVTSLQNLVTPYLDKIEAETTDDRLKTFADIIKTNLAEITRSFTEKLPGRYMKLTPAEIQVTDLIRSNKTTKEIAAILYVSEATVFFHRRSIRKKLGISNKKTNLRTFLQTLEND